MTTTGLYVELTSVSVMEAPVPDPVALVMPVTTALVQVKDGTGVVLLKIL